MSDVITKPGFYKQRNGGKAEVFCERDGMWFGMHYGEHGDPSASGTSWTTRGQWLVDEPGDSTHDITGPWIPDPPAPPEGFQVMPRDYVAKEGDKLTGSNWRCGWQKFPHCFDGMSAADIEATYPSSGTHWIASPIPKPFSISEHGIGVYETRDGQEEPVIGKATYGWEGNGQNGWYDDGRCMSGIDGPDDLVRYLRPLPKQEQPQEEWTPTNELRWKRPSTGWGSLTAAGAQMLNTLEQKWTCGEKSEWCSIPVSTEI